MLVYRFISQSVGYRMLYGENRGYIWVSVRVDMDGQIVCATIKSRLRTVTEILSSPGYFLFSFNQS